MKKCKTSKLKNKYQTHPKERERKTGKEIGRRTEDRKDFFFFFFFGILLSPLIFQIGKEFMYTAFLYSVSLKINASVIADSEQYLRPGIILSPYEELSLLSRTNCLRLIAEFENV